MPPGPGKYGARADALLREVDAGLCLVITLGGTAGHAFDVATRKPELLLLLPAILREVADAIEHDTLTRFTAFDPDADPDADPEPDA